MRANYIVGTDRTLRVDFSQLCMKPARAITIQGHNYIGPQLYRAITIQGHNYTGPQLYRAINI